MDQAVITFKNALNIHITHVPAKRYNTGMMFVNAGLQCPAILINYRNIKGMITVNAITINICIVE